MSLHKLSAKIFIYAALPCEAKPFIDFYQLKKDVTINCFAIYRNDNLHLIITGIGKTAMAAAIAYSQALFSSEFPVLLNVGIAGHKNHTLGCLFLVDKITDNDNGRSFYPPIAFTPPCPTSNLYTYSKPQYTYHPSALCDMEAAAFYETGVRFSSGELTQSLKIISDNSENDAQTVKPKQVSEWIAAKLPEIEGVLTTLGELANLTNTPEITELASLVNKYTFSVSEEIQLKKLLVHWKLINANKSIEMETTSLKSGKELLVWLNNRLKSADFHL